MQTDEFQALLAADEHWWYRGRRRVLHALLSRVALADEPRILDAGCGSGRTMDDLVRYGAITGFDLDPEAVERARERGHEACVARVEQVPHEDDTFDLVTCLDVIEHTPDDVLVLRELLRVARPGAILVLSVPAYQLLWSSHDEANLHYRRYRRSGLVAAGRDAGWQPLSATYFTSILLPAGAAVRLGERLRRQHKRRQRPHTEMTPPGVDPLLELPLRLEAFLIRRGLRLPAGMSLMAVFRNPAQARMATPPPPAAVAAGG